MRSCWALHGPRQHSSVCLQEVAGMEEGSIRSAGDMLCSHQNVKSSLQLTWKTSWPQMKAASRVRLCLPLPPTPTRSMLPPGCLSTRQMRLTCSTANRNMARFMGRLLMPALNMPHKILDFGTGKCSGWPAIAV